MSVRLTKQNGNLDLTDVNPEARSWNRTLLSAVAVPPILPRVDDFRKTN